MEKYKIAFAAMASRCEIHLLAENAVQAEEIANIAIAEVKRIESKYSRYREDSLLAMINQRAGTKEWVECDEETLALFHYADALYRTSDGLFDITSGIFRRVWDFKRGVVPQQEELEMCLTHVGWDKVERIGERIRLTQKKMEIDFGGFGKEYAVDRAVDVLMQIGVTQGLVNLGGDIGVVGRALTDNSWQIAIQHPRHSEEIIAYIPVYEGALTTSGDYERFFESEGKRYCHIINPKTGWPIKSWQSITVVAPRAIIAGGCATIAMLKEEKASVFLDACEMSYFMIDQLGSITKK